MSDTNDTEGLSLITVTFLGVAGIAVLIVPIILVRDLWLAFLSYLGIDFNNYKKTDDDEHHQPTRQRHRGKQKKNKNKTKHAPKLSNDWENEDETVEQTGNQQGHGVSLKTLLNQSKQSKKKGKGHSGSDRVGQHPVFVTTLKGHSDIVPGVCWSSDGKYLATACEDRVVRIFDMTNLSKPVYTQLQLRREPVDVAFGLDENELIVAYKGVVDRGCIMCYQRAPGQKFDAQPNHDYEDYHGNTQIIKLTSGVFATYTSREPYFVSLSKDRDAIVFNKHGEKKGVANPAALSNNTLVMSKDARFIAIASFSPDAKIYEIVTERNGAFKKVIKAMDLCGHRRLIQCVAISPDNKRAVTASYDGSLRIWNIDVRYQQQEAPKCLVKRELQLPGTCYQHMVFCTQNMIVASSGTTMHYLSAQDGSLVYEVNDAHDGAIVDMQWTSSGKNDALIATSGKDGKVRIWRLPQ